MIFSCMFFACIFDVVCKSKGLILSDSTIFASLARANARLHVHKSLHFKLQSNHLISAAENEDVSTEESC